MRFSPRVFRSVVGSAWIGIGIGIAATGLSSCTSKAVIDDGKLLVYNGYYRDDVKTLDPANAYDPVSLDAVANVYEPLYQYAYLSDTAKIVPLLAADMPKVSEDRLTVTIPIKSGVRFQDDPCFKETGGKGRELKAQDFVYAFKRLAIPALQSRGWWIFDGRVEGMSAYRAKLAGETKTGLPKSFGDEVSGVRALDDHTLQFKLTKPYPQLPYVLAMTFTAPVPHEAVTAYSMESGDLSEHPVGTGPFILKNWERGHQLVFDRNPTYHPEFYPTEGSTEARMTGMLADAGKPLPLLDRLRLHVVREEVPAWERFGKGTLDVMSIPKDFYAQAIEPKKAAATPQSGTHQAAAKKSTSAPRLVPALASRGVRLNIDVGSVFYYLSFNLADPLLGANKQLRQAISSALNRDEWITKFFNGRGQKMVTLLPPGTPDRSRSRRIKYDFDLDAAKRHLKKAGYPEGRGLPLINFDMRSADSLSRQMGEFFKAQMAAVGIRLNVIHNTFPAFLDKAKRGELQISYGGWSMDYPDAENAYGLLYGPNRAPGANESSFQNADFDRWFAQMAAMEPGQKRQALVEKLDEVVQEEVPWALGFFLEDYTLSQPWLLNFRASELVHNRAKYFRVNPDVKRRYMTSEARP